jgi:hypothetical protein
MKTGDFKKTSTLGDIDLTAVQDTGSGASGVDNEAGGDEEVVDAEVQDTSEDAIEETGEGEIDTQGDAGEEEEGEGSEGSEANTAGDNPDEDSSQTGDAKVGEGESGTPDNDESTTQGAEEVSEELILKRLSEKLGREVKSFDELTESENPLDKDPYLKGLADWREKTGRPIEDWIKFQKDYTKVSDDQIAREFLQIEYPELTPEEVDLELDTKFISSEDDLDNEAALKKLELKKYASKGRKELSKLVSEFGERGEVNYPKEVQQDLAIAKQYKALLKNSDSDNESYNNTISSEAEQIKSIKMDLAEGVALDFKIPAGSSKSIVDNIQQANHWKNEDGSWNHNAIVKDAAIVANMGAMLKLSYEQGKNSGADGVVKDAKNTTLGNRKSNDSAMTNKGKGVEIEGLDNYLGKKGMSIKRRS